MFDEYDDLMIGDFAVEQFLTSWSCEQIGSENCYAVRKIVLWRAKKEVKCQDLKRCSKDVKKYQLHVI